MPCPPAPPLRQGGQRPQRPPPRPHGSLACRETPRSSGTRWLPGSSSFSGDRLLQETCFSLGDLSGDSGPTGLAPSKRPQGSPDPGLHEVLVACSVSTEDPLHGPPPATTAGSGQNTLKGPGTGRPRRIHWTAWVDSRCQGWGLPPALTCVSAPRRAGPCPLLCCSLSESHLGCCRHSESRPNRAGQQRFCHQSTSRGVGLGGLEPTRPALC